MRLSALDLGSNSFHVLVADLDEDGGIVPVAREREMLHLGAVVAEHGHVPDAEREHAIEVVAHLTELAGRLGAQRRLAVATSALRDAGNGAEVVAEMAARTDTPIRIIDGEEEARLAYRGVRASIATDAAPLLVLDLGGGSLELVVGSGPEVAWSTSLDLGVSRLASLVRRDPPKKGEMRDLRRRVEEAVAPARPVLEDLAPALAVAVGGTVRNLARVAAADAGTWVPATINQLAVPSGEVAGLRDRLATLDTDERAAVSGMKAKRADRAHVAAAILAATLEALGIDEVVVSDWGLREGLLLEAMGAVVPPTRDGLRRREVERVQDGFSPDVAHVTHVADLAVSLFDQLPDVHGLDPADRELLWCGAALHDVGESLALRAHHRHGAYVLEHAEMRGFSPTETAMLCSMVRFHTSRGLSSSFAPYGALRRRDRRRVDALVALLQVADGLDRTRDQAVTGLHAAHRDGVVDLRLDGVGLHLTRTELDRRTALFARTFGVEVQVCEEAP